MTVRVGIIGTGGIAGLHVKGYKLCKDVELVACADISVQRAKDFASTHGFERAYDNYKKMLENEELDAISICTPNYAHCEPTVLALKAGINVLCEKPIAMNAKEAEKMVVAASQSKAQLSIGHHMRFAPYAQYLKKMLDRGELGHIYFARSQWLRRRGIPGWGQFHIKEKSGGGPLIDIGVHVLDLTMWLMGSPTPKSVSGSTYTKLGNKPEYFNAWPNNFKHKDYDVEDFACAMVKFTNEATLILEASWAAHLPELETLPQMLLGDKGGAVLYPYGRPEAPLRVFTSRDEAVLDIQPKAVPEGDPHMEELKHWVACVRGEKEVLVKPQESLNVQRILDAIYRSSESGKEVEVGKGRK